MSQPKKGVYQLQLAVPISYTFSRFALCYTSKYKGTFLHNGLHFALWHTFYSFMHRHDYTKAIHTLHYYCHVGDWMNVLSSPDQTEWTYWVHLTIAHACVMSPLQVFYEQVIPYFSRSIGAYRLSEKLVSRRFPDVVEWHRNWRLHPSIVPCTIVLEKPINVEWQILAKLQNVGKNSKPSSLC